MQRGMLLGEQYLAIFRQNIAGNIFSVQAEQTIWDICSDIDGGVVVCMAATFTSNICADVKLLEKPNI